MGLNMVNHNLLNWTTHALITHSTDHRLVSHIPTGTVNWDMQANAEDITWTGRLILSPNSSGRRSPLALR